MTDREARGDLVLGLTVGAALGLALPPTDTEDEFAGKASDALKRAVEKKREQVEALKRETPETSQRD